MGSPLYFGFQASTEIHIYTDHLDTIYFCLKGNLIKRPVQVYPSPREAHQCNIVKGRNVVEHQYLLSGPGGGQWEFFHVEYDGLQLLQGSSEAKK